LSRFKNYQIVLKGNTDADGNDVYNRQLSVQRTQAVFKHLVSKGVAPRSISTAALGETKPIADNTTSTGKQANRRVDILVTYTVENQAVAKNNLKTWFDKLALPPQTFQIQSNRDTILVCPKGSILTFEADCFDAPLGAIVTVKVKEILSKSDMLFENLTTTSNHRLLSSGGMMHIEALLETGQPVALKPNKMLNISIPTAKYEPQMQYFAGQRTHAVPTVDWKPLNKAVIENQAGQKIIDFPDFNSFLARNDKDIVLRNYARNQRNSKHANYYNFYLEQLASDTCGKLYIEDFDIHPADTIRRIVAHRPRHFWDQLMSSFSNKKDTLVRIRKERKRKLYIPLSNLSPKCRELAEFGKSQECRHCEHYSWQALDLILNQPMYSLLEKKFQTTDRTLLIARLKVKAAAFDEEMRKALKLYSEKRVVWYQKQDEAVNKAIVAGGYNKENLSYYLFKTNQLGWVNCDYFINNPDPVTVAVGLSRNKLLDAKIVFKDAMVAMNANGNGSEIAFNGVPRGRKAWLVVMDFNETTPKLALHEIEAGKPVPTLTFRSMSVAQIRNELVQLNLP
jgi:hypothetical protein